MTKQALSKVSPAQNIEALAKEFGQSEGYIQTVKDTIAVGATDNELRLFLETARRVGLDPMARQIFCVKRWSGGKEVISVQTSIDGFRLIADRTGRYVPSREPTFAFDKQGNLESATAYIKKFVAGSWHEISATAFYSEYVQTTKDGKPNSMWRKMPRLMLAKCAESLVLRKSFPAELSGLYTSEEMNTAPEDHITSELQKTHFEVDHEERTGQRISADAPEPEPEEPSLFRQIAEICQTDELKESFGTKEKLASFINKIFEGLDGYKSVESVRELDESDQETILDALIYQQQVILKKAAEPEVIEGEVVEDFPEEEKERNKPRELPEESDEETF